MTVYLRTYRLSMVLLLVVIAFATVLSTAAVAHDIHIGVLAHRGKETALRMWTPTAAYLARTIPEHRFEIIPLDFNQIGPAVGSGQVDFVISNPEIYVNLEAQYRVSRIATLKNMTSKGAYKEFGGVIFTRADRKDIKDIHDLKGKSVMAVEASSLGGWTMAWREIKAAGLDPYRDFAGLTFGGTHDDVVYAVRDRKADVGTIRSNTLERMSDEGKIKREDYYVINRQKDDGEFPFAVSTRLYPEWPFAKVRHTSDDLAESVAIALYKQSADDPASKAAHLEGWTIPLDYELVHMLMKELRIGVYKDYGKITVTSVMRQYGYWFVTILLVLAMYWNYLLRKRVRKRTLSLQQELEERRRLEQQLKLLSEEALVASEQRFKTLFENLADPVYISNMSGKIVAANAQASTELGYSNEEFLALGILDLDAVHTTPEKISEYFGNLSKFKAMTFETIHRRKDGSQFPVEVNVRLVDFDGQPAVMGVARNITERKQAEEERLMMEQQLLHTQKLESLGVLAGGIAHDFNNILTAIIGNADLALMRINKESPAVDNLHRIEQSASRAADLAKQMLAYSGKGKFMVESLDINKLVEEMLHMLEVSISKKAVLRLNFTRPLPAVEADATQIRQIIMNLVINASEAIGDKSGVIAITTGCMDCDDSYLKDVWLDENLSGGLYSYLEVADSGCGMDKDVMEKLFDPFFTTKFTGRGLGMAAVLGIVRGHHGAIKVYSEPGKGSSFKILFPASGRPAEIFNSESDRDEWRGSGTVLLVDDEETVRGIGTEMLKELGFEVITANDGRAGLDIFKSRDDIAFVILDLTMPHMDGEQCFCELRRIKPDVRVILSSGYNENEVTQKFVGKGLSGFIQKPYRLSVLKEAVKAVIY